MCVCDVVYVCVCICDVCYVVCVLCVYVMCDMCLYVFVHECVCLCLCDVFWSTGVEVKDSLWERVSSFFPPCGSVDGTRVTRLGSKHLY